MKLTAVAPVTAWVRIQGMIRLLSRGEAAIKTGRTVRIELNPTQPLGKWSRLCCYSSRDTSNTLRVVGKCSRRGFEETPLGGLTQAKRYRYICICGGQRASAGHQFRGTFDSGSCGLAGACKALISQCPFRSFLVLIVPASSCPLGPRAT